MFSALSLLSQNFENLYIDGQFSDFTIKVQNREFKIHKAILAARSPVFASMLRLDMEEKQTNMVDIPDSDPNVFEDFLYYLYSGNVDKISVENVTGLYSAAEKYDAPGLKGECIYFMKDNLTENVFCDVMTLALLHQDEELIECCIKYFTANTEKILTTVQWQSFVTENPVPANELYIKAR